MEQMFENTVFGYAVSLFLVVCSHYIANNRLGLGLAQQAIEDDNLAFYVRRLGLYVGIFIGALAATQNFSAGAHDVNSQLFLDFALNVVLLFLFMFTALKSADKFILSKSNNDDAVINGNSAVGIVEAAILGGTGLIAYGSLLGEGHIWTSVVFFLGGQTLFIGATALYEKFSGSKVKQKISDGDVGSALRLGSLIVAVALFVSGGIAGDFTSLLEDFGYLMIYFSVLMAGFLLHVVVLERLTIVPMLMFQDGVGASLVISSLRVSVACLLVTYVSI